MRTVLTATGRLAIGLAIAGAVAGLAVVALWDQRVVSAATAVVSVFQVPTVLVGAAAIRSAPRNINSWLLLVGGTALPVAIAAYLYAGAAFDQGADLPAAHAIGWFDGWPWVPALLAGALFLPLVFPDGDLPSRRWLPLLGLNTLLTATLFYSATFRNTLLDWDSEPNPTALPGAAGDIADALILTIVFVAPLTLLSVIGFERKRRHATDQTAAIMSRVRVAAWLFPVAWWACVGINIAAPSLYEWVIVIETAGMSAVGITCWLAIRRYHLFDTRTVLHRSVVYAALSVTVLVVYGVVAGVLIRVGAQAAATPLALVVAVLAAIPLHQRMQVLANRIVFGTRDDPVATLLALGDQLERAATDDVLPATIRTLRRTLRLQHVAVVAGEKTVAEDGHASGHIEAVPLIYAGERVGMLAITHHDDSPLEDERRAMLGTIARPIAAALHATTLARDLSRSHEKLISATEEERRRLRRDLHDGLGPTLSSAVLGISRAHALLLTRPEAASDQLEVLTRQLQEAVADVRRLVYDLRPPALDHLGLVRALREHAESLGHFTVTGPETITLPAATEVAAYRIAMEAMTNALRHGGVRSGAVQLSPGAGGIKVTITDDGIGIPEGYRAGVGITSMRERAEELGGSLDLTTVESGGTQVRAWLPA